MLLQWALRIVGYAVTAGAAWIGSKWGLEVGTAVGTLGGFALHKATKELIPKKPEP